METTGLDFRKHELVGVALAFSDGRSYYCVIKHTIPFAGNAVGHIVQDFIPVEQLRRCLRPLFRQDVTMVGHNVKFDMHFLHRAEIFVEGRLADTLLAAQLLNENRKNDLKTLSATILGEEYAKYQTMNVYKGYGKDEILGAPLEDVAEYAMNDVEATWKLYNLFIPQLAAEVFRGRSLLDVYNDLWMPILVVLQQMEARGIALDIEKVKTLREQYVAELEEHGKRVRQAGIEQVLAHYKPEEIPAIYLKIATEEQLHDAFEADDGRMYLEQDGVLSPIITHDMVGRPRSYKARVVTFNTGSPKQMHDLVFVHSGVNLPASIELKRTDAGTLSVDKDNLEMLIFYADEDTPAWLIDVLKWRKASKFITTYLDMFLERADPNDYNSITTTFNMAVARTGRLSSSGPNLQNIPSRGDVGAEARSVFVARPDNVLLVSDLGQAELRLLAHYSLDPELCLAFEEGRDLHILTGSVAAQMDYQELLDAYNNGDPQAKVFRSLGKTMNFALNYGMGPKKFRRFLIINNGYEISEDQAFEWIKGYNQRYEGVSQWKKDVVVAARRNKFVVTYGGRYRRVPFITSEDGKLRSYAERQAVNSIIQGGVGDIIEEAMIEIQPRLTRIKGSLILQVHDELVAEVPYAHAEEGKHIMETYMTYHCNPRLRVPQVTSCGVAKSWGEAK